jgi:mercuric ion transport protein
MDATARANTAINALALFATAGTLVCCAIPILLVTLGMGAAVAAATSSLPVLITLSQYKANLFAGSAILLVMSGGLAYRARDCPVDPVERESCRRVRSWNRRLLLGSITIWVIGFFAAYLALPLRVALGV